MGTSATSSDTFEMLTGGVRTKIVKEKNQEPDELEESVGKALQELEFNTADLKTELRDLNIVSAKQVDCGAGRQSIVVFVPYKQLKNYHKIQVRLVRELEKKFGGKHVILMAQRRIQKAPNRKASKSTQRRPRSRTLTAVHDAILEDVVYPTEIVGKRLRVRRDGQKTLKVQLDPKEQANAEFKTDTFKAVYKKLTGRDVAFEFPAQGGSAE